MVKKKFIFEKTVYLCDTNVEGNVYFSKYFEWQGQAREEFYKQHFPMDLWKSGLKLITVEASMEYKHEIFLFDYVLIEIKITNVKKMSLELVFTYTNKKTNQLIGNGREKIAFADASGKLVTIPDEIRKNLEYFLMESSIT